MAPPADDLFQAAADGDAEVFAAADDDELAVRDEVDCSLLHLAAANGQVAVAEALLERGVDPDLADESGQTALHYAAAHGETEVTALLLAYGGDTAIADEHGNGPLWTAVFNARGAYDLVDLLLEAGADPTAENDAGRSPLDFAAQIGDDDLLERLDSQ
ncbi:ankyrin repeat domain-containing protein [Natronobiforma cellulositropha]|uniref:ankyrin repeat domain-containing protein n=1 Tax=Natronobiforma cellulositropha TaxID=1679076 RepID=UPI0021D5DF81|nr:ankyrin repeat domain-containing protein [Natronobiforma cellulositropha]